MNNNFFSVLPDNFFNIFNGSYRVPAAECLTLLYQKTSGGLSFSMDKETAVFLFEEYFESTHQDIEDENSNHLNVHDSALYLLRRLRDCGWIEEELGENYQYFIHLQDFSVEIIKTLSLLGKESSIEYSGYIYIINETLRRFKIDRGAATLEQIYINTEELFRKLASLNTNIKKYIQKLLDDKTRNDLLALMNQLLDEFQTKIVDRAYYNLSTKDHPEKYKRFILEKVFELYNNDEVIDEIVRQYMDLKGISYTEALELTDSQFTYIIDSFESISDVMDEIDRKHAKYVNSAISRIKYLLDVHEDIEGKINRIIKAVAKDKVDTAVLFNITSTTNINDDSLYNARKPQQKMKNKSIEEIEFNYELIDRYKEKHKYDQRFSKKGINKYVNELLDGSTMKKASEIQIDKPEDFTYLILIYMYGYSRNVDFKIEELDRKVNVKGYTFKDFIIRRRMSYEKI